MWLYGLLCWLWFLLFFFKQKTAYELRISDWSSDVCSSDLDRFSPVRRPFRPPQRSSSAAPQKPPAPSHGRPPAPQRGTRAPARRLRKVRGQHQDRKSVVEGKSVSVRVDLGGRRPIIKKENT